VARSADGSVEELLLTSLAVVKGRLDWANRRLQADLGPEAALALVLLVKECVLAISAIQTSIIK